MILRSCGCFHSLCEMGPLPIVLSLKERVLGRAEILYFSMICVAREIAIKDIAGSSNSGVGNKIPG